MTSSDFLRSLYCYTAWRASNDCCLLVDFELIFGASKLGLKVVEVPVRYANRTYGETQISRFQHGLLLIRMVAFAYRKLKAL
jgi:hypothetical protein